VRLITLKDDDLVIDVARVAREDWSCKAGFYWYSKGGLLKVALLSFLRRQESI